MNHPDEFFPPHNAESADFLPSPGKPVRQLEDLVLHHDRTTGEWIVRSFGTSPPAANFKTRLEAEVHMLKAFYARIDASNWAFIAAPTG